MLIESILGNLFTGGTGVPPAPNDMANGTLHEIDWLPLTWQDCQRRALRRSTRSGAPIRILLPLGQSIRHGDILTADQNGRAQIAVELQPCDLLVVQVPSSQMLAIVAYELGNLHAAVEIHGTELATPPDGPVESLLASLDITPTLIHRRFSPRPGAVATITPNSQFLLSRKPIPGNE